MKSYHTDSASKPLPVPLVSQPAGGKLPRSPSGEPGPDGGSPAAARYARYKSAAAAAGLGIKAWRKQRAERSVTLKAVVLQAFSRGLLWCQTCCEYKPIASFFRDPERRFGYAASCRSCSSAKCAAWRKKRKSARAALGLPSPRKLKRDRRTPREKMKDHARHLVAVAIASGDLVRPDTCDGCFSLGSVHAHHDDYMEPLQVCWFCKSCHEGHHRTEKLR